MNAPISVWFASRAWIRVVTAVIWLWVGGLAVHWWLILQGSNEGPVKAPFAQSSTDRGAQPDALARLLGAVKTPVVVEAAIAPSAQEGRFVLKGVVFAAGKDQVAVIAVDGKPARAFAMGAEVAPGLTVVRVSRFAVGLGPTPGQASVLTLELPKPQSPS